MGPKQKRDLIYLILSGIFITNALLAEMIGGKLIQIGPAVFSLGVIPWPIVFITTDLINEYFGRDGVRKLTLFTSALIVYAFVILFIGINIPAVGFSPVNDESFTNVFGQSMWIIVGSLVAFLISQLVDVGVFWLVRARTSGRLLWLRATGSTAVSQLIDTFVVMGIGFYLPGKMNLSNYLEVSTSNYGYKLIIAIAMTPIIYFAHSLIDKALGQESHHLIDEAAKVSLKSS